MRQHRSEPGDGGSVRKEPADQVARSTKPGASRLGRLGFRVAGLTVGLLGAALILELGLRLFVPVTDIVFSFWDPVIGARSVPGQSGRYIRPSGPDGSYSFNAQGWNYPQDYVIPRTPGLTRMCIIGDSFVEGLHVDQADTLAVIAARTMTQAGLQA